VVFRVRTNGRQIEYPTLLSARGKPLQLEDIEICCGVWRRAFQPKAIRRSTPAGSIDLVKGCARSSAQVRTPQEKMMQLAMFLPGSIAMLFQTKFPVIGQNSLFFKMISLLIFAGNCTRRND
jgi:hypothetical protein